MFAVPGRSIDLLDLFAHNPPLVALAYLLAYVMSMQP